MTNRKRIIVGISGASGAILGVELLRALKNVDDLEIHLMISSLGEQTISYETDLPLNSIKELAHHYHPINQLDATIASGSFNSIGMVIVPCSMKTLAGIASGYSDNLLLRAADVCLKERRKLVVVPRESPFNGIHLKNLSILHQEGAVILPAMMTFYHNPVHVQDMVDQFVGKILQQFDIHYSKFKSWQGE